MSSEEMEELEVQDTALTTAMNAAISGMAGIGHILLGIGIVLLLLQIRASISISQ